MADTTSKGDGSHGEPGEDEGEKLTRNLNELLQELRVMQTGVQILTGFLLTVPFSSRFGALDSVQKTVYLTVLCGSALSTGLIVAPVAFHRTLFRQGERKWIVEAANNSARQGLVALAVTTAGVIWLVFDVVVGPPVSHIAGVVALGVFALLWGVLPIVRRRRFD